MKTLSQFNESTQKEKLNKVFDKFVPFVKNELNIKHMPPIKFISNKESQARKTFGSWNGESITLCPDNRHPMDVMRTLAHELVHYTHGHTNGEDGSDDENEANAKAGLIMRRFASHNQDLF